MPADTTQTLRRFDDAFAQLDGDTMAACHAQDARFDDAIFSLRGRREAGRMGKMPCAATNPALWMEKNP